MTNTNTQYNNTVSKCLLLFMKKANDYGLSWKVLRLPSLTDQIMIKLDRVRTIQETNVNCVGDSIEGEFIAVVNYCVMALMYDTNVSMGNLEVSYQNEINQTRKLMELKNSDYGEAWRKMRVSSIVDLMLMKIARLKQIEDNKGVVIASEGVRANYMDILNYAVFCLIRSEENATK